MFQVSCLRFINRFIETSQDVKERIMIQTELEEAGFDPISLKNLFFSSSNPCASKFEEIIKIKVHLFENIPVLLYIHIPLLTIHYFNEIVDDDISGECGRNDVLEDELERWAQNYIDVNR